MINITENMHLHNRFDLQLIDSTTGKVKQEAHAENVVLNQIWNYMNNEGNEFVLMRYIVMGTGTGTPEASDTGLFTEAFSSGNVTQLSKTIGNPTSTLVGQVTFSASSSYVGELTEIGIKANLPNGSGRYTGVMLSHALLVDSEGNPITISKTSLDVLVVTATLYLTISGTKNFKPAISYSNRFIRGLTTEVNSYPGPLSDATIALYTCPVNVGNNQSAIALTNASKLYRNRKLDIVANRLLQGVGNTNYISGIGIPNHGFVPLPNSEIFPNYTMRGISIGTGNGSTTDFKCPIPVFVGNSDVLYANGAALVRGVDYTIDNMQNADQLSCISAFNFADVSDQSTPYDYIMGVNVHAGFTTASIEGINGYTIKPTAGYAFDPITIDIVAVLNSPDPIVGKKVNTVYLPFSFRSQSSVRCSGTVSIYGSNDGVTWNNLAMSLPFSTSASGSSAVANTSVSASFDTVEYNYIKASITVATCTEYNPAYMYRPTHNAPAFVGYVGNNIHFAQAPASNTILTMDCTLDRPFKNENFVIDAALSVQF